MSLHAERVPPTHSRNSNVPDRGPSRDEYSILHWDYHDTLQGGTTNTSYGVSHGSMYPPALQSSSLQPGTPVYDMAPHASRPPPAGPRPPTEVALIDSVQSVQSAYSSYPLGFARQQSSRHMTFAGPSSEGSAGTWNPLAGSYSHQSTSESHFSYNPGGFRLVNQQNQRPIAPVRPSSSQGPAGVQNTWAPISQVYFKFTFLHRPLLEDNSTTMTTEKRKALVVCNGQTEYRTHTHTDSYGHRRLGLITPNIQTATSSYDTALGTPMP